ncbi:hypothetical protein C5167_046987 [Papaver somniferum]|uniref:Uncharacterized protein n=2 Tax=Papaver somniferum TaxID=3469 RepID=A0A4Y7LIY1_PAPSO|nr:hypothetical protein C5167_046987 [Papaver somniferum]
MSDIGLRPFSSISTLEEENHLSVCSENPSPYSNFHRVGFSRMALTDAEAPFRPRELLLEKQKLFQSIQKHTHLKGRYDKLTSVAIPLGLAIACGGMIAQGIYNMSHGIGKKE